MTLAAGLAADARIPFLGASGAIAAVLGVCFVFLSGIADPHACLHLPRPHLGLGRPRPPWFLFQLVEANFSPIAPATSGGVAFFAHVGGFIFGVLVAGAGRVERQDCDSAFRGAAA